MYNSARRRSLFGLSLKMMVSVGFPIYIFFSGVLGLILLVIRIYNFFNSLNGLPANGNLQLYYCEFLSYILQCILGTEACFLAVLLRKAAISKHVFLMKIWVMLSTQHALFITTLVLLTSFTFFAGVHPVQSAALSLAFALLNLCLTYAVSFYANELRYDEQMNAAVRLLSDVEISDFLNGTKFLSTQKLTKDINLLAKYSGYQRHFEISMDHLDIDWNNPLGKGEFGAVFKATLDSTSPSNDASIVAVKVIDSDATDVNSFKLMLSELKVLTYVGEHPNIVRFVGANTNQILNRKLFIVLEFCAMGNLLQLLKGCRGVFVNLVQDRILDRSKEPCSNTHACEDETISTTDLLEWSRQISLGMEFLSSIKLVHGDLAARNVLITDQRTAKITDFGLSRQLYDYSVYIKKSNKPVPWRNVALESIIDHSVSTYSDVWSFAITLWEIFTLGDVPYCGYDFGNQFIRELRDGMRPAYPHNAPLFIHELMQACWNKIPDTRPTFTEIQQILSHA